MPAATLVQFTQVNDAAAATTRKLQKQAIVAEFLRALDDDDLRLAIRYAAGRVFAATDERTLNVGWAIVTEVLLDITKLDPNSFHDLVVKNGEIGEALSTIWARSDVNGPASLTLVDLSRAFDALASTGVRERKRDILYQDLFTRCHTAREAAYVAKIISGDMRTGVQEGVLQHAVAEAFSTEGKAIQRCQLLVGDLGEVAVLAKHGACATAQFRLFHPIQSMLATPQETAQDAEKTMAGRTFIAEDKLDGIRAQVHKSGDRIAIYTRTLDRADASFPDVVAAMRQIPGEFLLDGEIVPFANGEVLPFAHIQKRLGRKLLTQKILRENPAVFIAFDLLYREGALLMDRPLRERRGILSELIPDQLHSSRVENQDVKPCALTTRTSEVSTAAEIDASFCLARECRNEGLVLKDPDSIYSPGRRGQMWLKLKTHLPTFDCVVTAAEWGNGKRRSVLSDYTFAVWDHDPSEAGAALVNIGKAYSGLTDEEIATLTKLFLEIVKTKFGRVHIVEPKVVLEIACDQIQQSKRHASGYAMRFPRIKRIRWDKGPLDADRLSRVVEVYESFSNTARSTKSPEVIVEVPEPTLFD